jgi:hypothetical protein
MAFAIAHAITQCDMANLAAYRQETYILELRETVEPAVILTTLTDVPTPGDVGSLSLTSYHAVWRATPDEYG